MSSKVTVGFHPNTSRAGEGSPQLDRGDWPEEAGIDPNMWFPAFDTGAREGSFDELSYGIYAVPVATM